MLHSDSPACFSCSIVSFEGSGFFSCVSVLFNFDLSNFSISVISGLSDIVTEGVESCKGDESGLRWPMRALLQFFKKKEYISFPFSSFYR